MTIGERLKQWRKENKITTPDIYNKTGISTGAISMFENGVRQSINSDTLIALHNTYGLDVNWLLTGEEDTSKISEDQVKVLEYYEQCDNETKADILKIIKRLASNK